ncbi:MAG TPA: 4Fe-4S cluster-binding domain-containing protein [Bacteroidales bacterium]|nr:4Fe-4S cluster-binding domain-containing protein [Bacteroidales bacterium]
MTEIYSNCTLCPRNCHADRINGRDGYCRMDAGWNIASVCIHKGEEPVVGGKDGICNIFFSGCNLHCIYCQNHEISQPARLSALHATDKEEVLSEIITILSNGISSVGFVSPSHMIPGMKEIIAGIYSSGYRPVIIYNTNSYDKVEVIRGLDGIVDVYLPDFKYVSSDLAGRLSGAFNYGSIALSAIKEMYRQMGSSLITDENGKAERGMLIRHLVLPGHTDESKKVLATIAEELSTGVNISLMAQYYPMHKASETSDLNRALYKSEYDEVVSYMHELGFRNGWLQEIESNLNYLPDFSKDHPFEA